MSREGGTSALGELPRMLRFMAAGDNADSVRIQVQGRGHADGFRWHGVRMPIVEYGGGGTDIDGDAKSQIFRPHFQRTKSSCFLG